MSAPPPSPPLPLSTAPMALPIAPLESTAGASTGQTPPPSTAPPVAIYLPPAAATGPATLPWYSATTAPIGPLHHHWPHQPPPAVATGPAALPWYAATTAPIRPLHHHWLGQPLPAVAPHWTQWPAPAIAAPPTPPGSGQPQPQLPAPPPPAAAPQWPQWPAPALAAPPTPPGSMLPQPQLPAPPLPSTGPGSPSQGGVPIQQVRFPPSPSPIPAWLTGSSPPPVYTSTGDPPAPTLQFGDPSGSAGHSTGRGHTDRVPQSSLLRTSEPVGHDAPTQTPPRFAKLDFATYDGTEDPLNWLNQCEQFFRGQRTLASKRTWLASYHLRGAA
nr:vegetative cell wall protein gp1-like [Aegilops tauschii subsp. strangulata]